MWLYSVKLYTTNKTLLILKKHFYTFNLFNLTPGQREAWTFSPGREVYSTIAFIKLPIIPN